MFRLDKKNDKTDIEKISFFYCESVIFIIGGEIL